MLERPDKPESEFTEEDWQGVRFRNLLKMCVKSTLPQEPMRQEDHEIFRNFRDGKNVKSGRKARK